MAYGDNWLQHLTAPLTGRGGSKTLARDFWPSEDLWNPELPIRRRYLKLVWVYALSVLTQFSVLSFVICILIHFFYKPLPFKFWMIIVGGGTIILWAFLSLIAVAECVGIARNTRESK